MITLKRVPIGFNWKVGVIWFGYQLPEIECLCCEKKGIVNWKNFTTCPICKGKGKFAPIIDVPQGKAYQIWETQNYMEENSQLYYPVSQVHEDPYELAEWCAENYTIKNDPLISESNYYEAIMDGNVEGVFGLYRENITLSQYIQDF